MVTPSFSTTSVTFKGLLPPYVVPRGWSGEVSVSATLQPFSHGVTIDLSSLTSQCSGNRALLTTLSVGASIPVVRVHFAFSYSVIMGFGLVQLATPTYIRRIFFIRNLFYNFSTRFLSTNSATNSSLLFFLPTICGIRVNRGHQVLIISTKTRPTAMRAPRGLICYFKVTISLLIRLTWLPYNEVLQMSCPRGPTLNDNVTIILLLPAYRVLGV